MTLAEPGSAPTQNQPRALSLASAVAPACDAVHYSLCC